jgi:hypothetical protein
LLTAERIASRTASLTASGTCVPARAVEVRQPLRERGEVARTGATSKLMRASLPDRVQDRPGGAGSTHEQSRQEPQQQVVVMGADGPARRAR